MENETAEIEVYAENIISKDEPIPTFLKWTYFILPIWGIIAFYLYWNGSAGWLDRGYWRQLQAAANTTFPIHNQNMPDELNIKLDRAEEKQIQRDLE
jgi:hypothetical protein